MIFAMIICIHFIQLSLIFLLFTSWNLKGLIDKSTFTPCYYILLCHCNIYWNQTNCWYNLYWLFYSNKNREQWVLLQAMNMTTINSTNWHVHVSNEQSEGHSHRKVKVNIYISHKTFPKFAHLALIVHASFGVWLGYGWPTLTWRFRSVTMWKHTKAWSYINTDCK